MTTSSPLYPKSNGFAERLVQVAKNLILKSKENNESLWYALLEYRNTPIQNSELSSTQVLMGRQTRTLLPGHVTIYKNENSDQIIPILKNNIKENEKYYNSNAKLSTKFKDTEKVWIKENKHWVPGTIIKQHETPRSYMVKRDSKIYRRNPIF